ncbi:NADPH:quinone reductase [Acidisphaera sp. L21]|uniref:NADPH:quinone reductase n=1 Tax=Acidisphaera sp. L21 TaxID=1641851 RepID=UPI00131B372F|nr:NADPH:quinone reductase [Acidisphaera sp. L21]
MLAAFYERQGAAKDVLRVEEMPTPNPGPGEVRVRLRSSGVNPSDVKSRAGSRPMPGPRIIPHSDGAGEIDAVGAGVPESRVGERVWIWNGQWKRPWGTAAEYIALPSRQAVLLPAEVDWAAGACLGIPALTAWQAVRLAGAEPGRTLLVAGGAGAVGHYAIQIARARGAQVLTTTSSEAKAAHATAAGAHATIDRHKDDLGEKVRSLTNGLGVDGVVEVDFTANARHLPATLRPRGHVAIYGIGAPESAVPVGWMLFNSITAAFFIVYELSDADRAIAEAGLGAMLTAGSLQHAVGLRLPLRDIVAAHEAVEQGRVIGNVVLEMG